MKQYDIYKSEGGYRVAAGIYLGCPNTDFCPWFARHDQAAIWRAEEIRKTITRKQAEGYPYTLDIPYLTRLLDRPQKQEA